MIDVTDEFLTTHSYTGSKAREEAQKYLIGKIKGQPLGTLYLKGNKEEDWSGNEIEPTNMNTYVTLGFLVVAAGLAYQFYLKDRL